MQDTVRVAAVQMKMRWYEHASDFAYAVDERVSAAGARGAELVVFPEDVGLPLLGLGDLDVARSSTRTDQFALRIILRHSPRFLATVVSRRCSARRAILLLKAPLLREAYFGAFEAAARKHGVWIVAGSIPLPPRDTGSAEIYNQSAVFAPDGERRGLVRKVDLIPLEAEALHLTPGKIEDLPVFEASFGKFAVAICADNWNAELVASLHRRGAEIICNPAANPEEWNEEQQASHREGLFARCQELPIFGVQASGIGQWLDIVFEGQSCVVAPRELTADESGYIALAETHNEEQVLIADLDLRALRDLADVRRGETV